MTDNDLNTETIRQLLNRSAQELDRSTLDRLRVSREMALQRHARIQSRPPMLAWISRHWHAPANRPASWVTATLLLMALVGGGYYWQQMDNDDEVDIAILTDELPIDYYVN